MFSHLERSIEDTAVLAAPSSSPAMASQPTHPVCSCGLFRAPSLPRAARTSSAQVFPEHSSAAHAARHTRCALSPEPFEKQRYTAQHTRCADFAVYRFICDPIDLSCNLTSFYTWPYRTPIRACFVCHIIRGRAYYTCQCSIP